jgi:hypothetical protein
MIRHLAILVVTGALLAGCSTIGGKPDPETLALLREIVTGTSCAHDDQAEAIVGAGGIAASFHVKVERHCPVQPPAPAPTVP